MLFKHNETETSEFLLERVLAECGSKNDYYRSYLESEMILLKNRKTTSGII